MARRTKYEFGKTYYSILEVELTEQEGRQAERHEFSAWQDEPEAQRYQDAMEYFTDQMPTPETARESAILNIAKNIGYVEAMAERKLWWGLQQSQHSKNAWPTRKRKTANRHGKLVLDYLTFIGQGKTDLAARKAILKDREKKNKKPSYDLSALARILTAQEVR